MPSMIDLDQNATTPLDPEVFEAMRPYFLEGGNPESRHTLGRASRRGLDRARDSVAALLNCDPSEVVFTSGGTEANNIALFGLAGIERGPGHLLTSPVEHPAVVEPIAHLKKLGYEVDTATVDSEGLVDAAAMAERLRFDTRFATLMLANNEVGAIQPVARLASLAAERGLPTHTDAVQAVGRIPVDFRRLGVATLAAGAHKFHGPSGVGLLLVRKGISLRALTFGGAQQGGRRPGTPAVALAVGLAVALERSVAEADARRSRWVALRDRLEALLVSKLGRDGVVRNGPIDESARLPQTLSVAFPGLDGDSLLMGFDLAGVAASLGSACAGGATRPSPTLVAMGLPRHLLRSSVRFSLGAFTTEAEVEEAAQRVSAVVERIKSPH